MNRLLRIIMLDHRDSFVFNLVRYFEELGATVTTLASHKTSLAEIEAARPDGLVLSPGPCTPNEAGSSPDIVAKLAGQLPILGVCLGHQIIAQAFGWTITRATAPLYGEARDIKHSRAGLFSGLPDPLGVGLYHSLIAQPSADSALSVTATSPAGEVMGLRHTSLPIHGVQFHPESILTEHGHALLANFLQIVETQKG